MDKMQICHFDSNPLICDANNDVPKSRRHIIIISLQKSLRGGVGKRKM